ncbi:unnamed protein product, partial [Effrenium voratum]
AFHAIGITLLPWQQIVQLRTRAVRTLGFGHAGAHPGIRLALLSGNYVADPGAYQLIRVFQDFKRFIGKNHHLVDLWCSFAERYQGHLLAGPCSKLIEQCDLILWKIAEPPVFVDHMGLPLDLLRDPWPHIRERLLDAWTQRLSREVAHRHDYAGLHGLTWPPSDKELRLSALDVARVNALREGGLQQDVNRAELRAILAAVTWLHLHRVLGTVWSDSAYAACGCAALVQDLDFETPETNSDLWEDLRHTLSLMPANSVLVQHVSAHREHSNEISDLEDWTAYWNQRADDAAGRAHRMRPDRFWHIWGQFRAHQLDSFAAVDRFRDLHLDVASMLYAGALPVSSGDDAPD